MEAADVSSISPTIPYLGGEIAQDSPRRGDTNSAVISVVGSFPFDLRWKCLAMVLIGEEDEDT